MASVEHFSIPVDDIERARAFYSDVFGFGYEPWDATRGVLRTGGGIDGDLHVRAELPHPTITVSVDDLEATIAAVLAHGGEQLGAIEALTESSRSAYVRDSEGNILALFGE
ncbi:VOC family protein [Rathayibacter sp. VKM Ac-2803]|uniref:VOC family protein n=1 Tax=Rathayibacter sp. VKM Ac-2803 TaxID=2609256 RepID=UPI00135CE22F|nr:VOC family protein [Rathayibacter sp. VKM Ac-2803]MWV48658.1 VOC family protein [Rathayibacter sp. VKM Ac-2803]